jgi:pimeloyl-ACP methyl ester carboxylesterase
VEDITNYITWLDLKNVILVGHSYGGVVITGVADRIGDRIAHVVYVDTVPLNHGENILDVSGETLKEVMGGPVMKSGGGWRIPADSPRDPLPTMRDHPWKTYTERVDLKGKPPKFGTIIVGTKDAEVFGHMRTEQAPVRAKARGWDLHVVEGPHVLQEVSPSKEDLAKILLDIARGLE